MTTETFFQPAELTSNGNGISREEDVTQTTLVAAPSVPAEKAKPPRKSREKKQEDSKQKPSKTYTKALKADFIDNPRPLAFADDQDSTEYVLGWIYTNVIVALGLEDELEMAESLIAQAFTRGLASRYTSNTQRFKLLQQIRQLKAATISEPERAEQALLVVQGQLKELRSAAPIEQAG